MLKPVQMRFTCLSTKEASRRQVDSNKETRPSYTHARTRAHTPTKISGGVTRKIFWLKFDKNHTVLGEARQPYYLNLAYHLNLAS